MSYKKPVLAVMLTASAIFLSYFFYSNNLKNPSDIGRPQNTNPVLDTTPKPKISPAPGNTITIPSIYQIPNSTFAKTANSMDEWLSNYSSDLASEIRAFSDRYQGLYKIKGPGQIAWMAEHGYPMPEDLLAASTMSTDQLCRLTDENNVKASYLLYDRLISDYVQARDAYINSGNSRDQFNLEAGAPLVSEISRLSQKLNDTDSPFIEYLRMRDFELSQSPDSFASEAGIVSGLVAAQQLGDTHASDLLRDCINSNQCDPHDVGLSSLLAARLSMAKQSFCPNYVPISQMPDK